MAKKNHQNIFYFVILILVTIGCIVLYQIINPGANSLRKAQQYYHKKEFILAAPFFKEAIEKGSKNPLAFIHLAQSYTVMGNFDEAIKWYKYYLKIQPNDFKARLEFARVLTWAKHFEEAEKEYQDLLRENINAK
jgi:tetratricopeptide (TPR) repeat protein